MSKQPPIRQKVVLLGDGYVGKTYLILQFRTGNFPMQFIPTFMERYIEDIEINGKRMELEICDTAGQEDYDRLRPLDYPGTNVFLLCFSVDDSESFENIELKWILEITHFCPGTPFILVGCKADLRNDSRRIEELRVRGEKMISAEYGEAMARRIGANTYLECSSKLGEGVEQVFRVAATITSPPASKKKRKDCVVV
ncbi:GTP-binding protein rhoA [Serendipita vermifera]|nr:GTP-binding protein rhoA [Serendipita vermifera]